MGYSTDIRQTGGYGVTISACVLTAAAGVVLQPFLDLVNIIMLFLLVVLVAATRYGRGPAVLAALLGVALFDFFLVPPHLSFAVSDAQYLITFAVMLAWDIEARFRAVTVILPPLVKLGGGAQQLPLLAQDVGHESEVYLVAGNHRPVRVVPCLLIPSSKT